MFDQVTNSPLPSTDSLLKPYPPPKKCLLLLLTVCLCGSSTPPYPSRVINLLGAETLVSGCVLYTNSDGNVLPYWPSILFWPLRGSCVHMIHIHTLKVYVYILNKNECIFKSKAKCSCIWPNVVSEWASMLKNFCLVCFYQKDLGCCWGASSRI